jgi:tetratricopeptide (TPR) repeat protein
MRARSLGVVTSGTVAMLGGLALLGCGVGPARLARTVAAHVASGSTAAPAEDPFDAALAALIGHDAAGDWDDAACTGVAARFAGATDPPRAPALYDAAVVELRCNHDAAALGFLDRAFLADPDSVPARVLRARVLALRAARARDFAGAQHVLARALEQDGTQETLLGDLAQVYVAEVLAAAHPGGAALDLAAKACDAAIAKMPRSGRLLRARAMLAMKERRFADARADLDRAVALDPSAREPRLDAAALAESMHDFAGAEARYRAVLEASPDDFDVQLRRAIALRGRLVAADPAEYEERYRAARDAVATAIAVAPERPEGSLELAVLLLEHGSGRAGNRGSNALFLAIDVLGAVSTATQGKPALSALHERALRLKAEAEAPFTCVLSSRTSRQIKDAEAEAKQKAAASEAAGTGDEQSDPPGQDPASQ